MTVLSRMLGIAEAIDKLECITPEEIRPIDLKEFQDAVKGFHYERGDFSNLLCTGLGLLSFSVRIFYAIYKGEPAFLGTAHRSVCQDTKTLCGFAWAEADKVVPKLERLEIIQAGTRALILDDDSCSKFECRVHKENLATLKHWHIARKMFPETLIVEFHEDYFDENYCVVRIFKR